MRSECPVILIKRPHDAGGILRKMIVEIDGQVAARLSQGEHEKVLVEPGVRRVQARVGWCTSPPLDLPVAVAVAAERRQPAVDPGQVDDRPSECSASCSRGPDRCQAAVHASMAAS